MEEVIKRTIETFESTLIGCVEHHNYRDSDEAPIYFTIGDIKVLVDVLKESLLMY